MYTYNGGPCQVKTGLMIVATVDGTVRTFTESQIPPDTTQFYVQAKVDTLFTIDGTTPTADNSFLLEAKEKETYPVEWIRAMKYVQSSGAGKLVLQPLKPKEK